MKCDKCGLEASFLHVMTSPTRIPTRKRQPGPRPKSTQTYWCLKCAEPEEARVEPGSVRSLAGSAGKLSLPKETVKSMRARTGIKTGYTLTPCTTTDTRWDSYTC